MSFKSDINRIGQDIENLIKNEIKSQGLVDTGKLLNSIEVKIDFGNDGAFEMEVFAEDYFEFLNETHGIMTNVTNSSQFKSLEEDMAQAYLDSIEEEFIKTTK